MKCPNCNNKVDLNAPICPYCNHELVTIKEKFPFHIAVKGKLLAFITSIVGLCVLLELAFSHKLIYINKVLVILNIVLKMMLVISIVGIIICLILFYFMKKKTKIVKTLLAIFSIIIVVSTTIRVIGKGINIDPILKDYSKAEYIQIGVEKVPSIYSVVGKRKILINFWAKDQIIEGTSIPDAIAIIYTNLSDEDIDEYKKALRNSGFVEREIYNTEENEYEELFLKNNLEDKSFYVISIDSGGVVYATATGTYQNALRID